MFKKTIRLRINSINLNKINFSLSPSIPLLKKDDLCLILNNAPFENFRLILKSKGGGARYSIVPYKPFKYTDTLYIQIINPPFQSYRYKIHFAMTLNKGCGKTTFKIPGNVQGKYSLRLTQVNGIQVNLESNSFVVSRPIDQFCSSLYSCKRSYAPGEYIELLLYLLTIDGCPVPDGLYEIEIIESDD